MEVYVMVVKPEIRLTASALIVAMIAAGSSALPGDCRASSNSAKNATARQSESSPRGQILALSCASCHGTDGKSSSVIPTINGRSVEYIETALKGYKSGDRPSTVMARHAKGYSDEELRLISEYFGKLSTTNK